jgi:hypothetical protein
VPAGNVLFSLNTHESAGDPDTFPGFAHSRREFMNPAGANIVLNARMVLFIGDIAKCNAAFPHIAALPGTVPRQALAGITDFGVVNPSMTLGSAAIETFDNGGVASGSFDLCDAGFALVPFDALATPPVGTRTVFSFPTL